MVSQPVKVKGVSNQLISLTSREAVFLYTEECYAETSFQSINFPNEQGEYPEEGTDPKVLPVSNQLISLTSRE